MTTKPRKTRAKPVEDERLDATPERIARAEEAGRRPRRRPDAPAGCSTPSTSCARRGPWPRTIPAQRVRWLIGEALRRVYSRAGLDALRAVAPDKLGQTGFGPRSGLPVSEIALHARDKLRAAQERAGPAAWPVINRIILEGGGVRECRGATCRRS